MEITELQSVLSGWFRLADTSTNRIQKRKSLYMLCILTTNFNMPFSKLGFQLFQFKFIIRSQIAQTNNTKQAQSATPTVISRTELLVTSGTVPFKVSTLPVPHSHKARLQKQLTSVEK